MEIECGGHGGLGGWWRKNVVVGRVGWKKNVVVGRLGDGERMWWWADCGIDEELRWWWWEEWDDDGRNEMMEIVMVGGMG